MNCKQILQSGPLYTSYKWSYGAPNKQGYKCYNLRQTHLFSAIYRGSMTPFITIVGAHLVEGIKIHELEDANAFELLK